MKKLLLVLLIPILLLGCISSGEEITVKKDGSGQIIQTFKIKRDFVGFLNLSDQPSDPNLIDMETLENTAAGMGEGVVLEKVEPMPDDSPFAGYKAYYSFKDISKVRANASPSTSPEGTEESEGKIRFAFTPGSTATLTIIMPPPDNSSDEEASDSKTEESGPSEDAGMDDQLKQIYKDMHYWIKINVEGDIVKTNAHHIEGSTVTLLDMTFDKIVDNDELFEKVTSDDSGKDMDAYIDELTAAGVLIENQDKIDVRFK